MSLLGIASKKRSIALVLGIVVRYIVSSREWVNTVCKCIIRPSIFIDCFFKTQQHNNNINIINNNNIDDNNSGSASRGIVCTGGS